VFRHRHRRAPFADPLNWTDYRWDASPWRGGVHRSSWTSRPRGRGGPILLRLLLIGLAILFGVRLFSGFQSRSGSSWAKRGLYAAVLLMIAAAFSRNRFRRTQWW